MTVRAQLGRHDRKVMDNIMGFINGIKPYNYLELGSYLGASLVAHLKNPHCQVVMSIDKRSKGKILDERMIDYAYNETTQDMIDELVKHNVPLDKLITLEGTIDDLASDRLYDLAFIDAEHTNSAVLHDATKCLEHLAQDAIIMFHDDWIVFTGIEKFEDHVLELAMHARKFKMPHSDITAMVFGGYVDLFNQKFGSGCENWQKFRDQAAQRLEKIKSKHKG